MIFHLYPICLPLSPVLCGCCGRMTLHVWTWIWTKQSLGSTLAWFIPSLFRGMYEKKHQTNCSCGICGPSSAARCNSGARNRCYQQCSPCSFGPLPIPTKHSSVPGLRGLILALISPYTDTCTNKPHPWAHHFQKRLTKRGKNTEANIVIMVCLKDQESRWMATCLCKQRRHKTQNGPRNEWPVAEVKACVAAQVSSSA